MLSYIRNKKGQSLIEYSLILGAIIIGILFMQLYVRRGIEGRLKSAADDLGDQYSSSAIMNVTTNQDSLINEVTVGQTTTTSYIYSNQTKTGNETLPAANAENWSF